MAIKKQEFYEGAALHQLIRNSGGARISYSAPFFVLDDRIQLHLKYSTGVRSPWGFTFSPEEQQLLKERADVRTTIIGLICGSDGVAALPYDRFVKLAAPRGTGVRVACARLHREHFEVSGPDGVTDGKIAPSDWLGLLRS